MVRKRSRKYSSDDNDSDSDCTFSVDIPPPSGEPTAKKYSLRERKGPNFGIDFDFNDDDDDDDDENDDDDDNDDDYYEDDNVAVTQMPSDNDEEEFKIEPELIEVEGVPAEPPTDGLIDFEDIIRADIVVNRNKIDYDNLIHKNEIRPHKKRGRKQKMEAVICEPQFETTAAILFDEMVKDDELCKDIEPPEEERSTEIFSNGTKIEFERKLVKADLSQLQPCPDCSTNTDTNNADTKNNADSNNADTKNNPDSNNADTKNNADSNNADTKNTDTNDNSQDDDVIVIEAKHEIIVLDD